MGAKTEIEFDLEPLLEGIAGLLEARSLQGLPNLFLHGPLSLLEGFGLDVGITGTSTAPGTGHHVIRLGVLRNAEVLGPAPALEPDGDSICWHVASIPEVECEGLRELYAFADDDPKPEVVRGVFAAMLRAAVQSPAGSRALLRLAQESYRLRG